MASRFSRSNSILALAIVAAIGALLLLETRQGFFWFKGYNGDHFYYSAMALQFAGHGYEQSITEATKYFNYPLPANRLDFGFLNPSIAPLIYPRTALPLMAAPFVNSLGVAAMYIPGFACGCAATASLTLFAWRRFGISEAVLIVPLALLSKTILEFGFGIYTESQVFLILSLFLWLMPWTGIKHDWRHVLSAMLLIGVLVFTRQVVVVPAAMAVGGMTFATLHQRSLRNPWLPFAVGVVAAAGLATVAVNKWAPYSPLPALEASLKVTSMRELLPLLFERLWHALNVDALHAWRADTVFVVVCVLALWGAWRLRSSALPYVTIGALVAGLATTALNGLPNTFRYLFPATPLILVLAAVGLAHICHLITHLFTASESPTTARQITQTRHGATVTVITWGAVLALVLGATIVVSQSSAISTLQSQAISRAQYGKYWPLTDDSGTLYCSGDDFEVWFRNAAGTLYAFSGTAMAKSFSTPRLISRSFRPVTHGWPDAQKLLADGRKLCKA